MRIPGYEPSETPGVDDQKDHMRRDMLARRADVPSDATRAAADALALHLPSHAVLRDLDPGPILIPTCHRTEIDTDPLARSLEAEGWSIVRPRTHSHDLELEPVPWPSDATLVTGRWGVQEPPRDAPPMAADDLAAIIVPGVAFDATGRRLGMGSGVFDRFLPRARKRTPSPPAIGIGYRFQLVAAVPTAPHDARLDGLQLETHALCCPSA